MSTRARMRIFGVLLAAVCAAGSLAAQDKGRLTATDVFNIQIAQDPQISPDGKKIVYVRAFADAMTDRRYTNLWIMNADGTEHRPLTTGNRRDSSPRWSPDGTRLAFIAEVDEKPQIFVRWLDTGQTARVTSLENAPAAIAWSPDGSGGAHGGAVQRTRRRRDGGAGHGEDADGAERRPIRAEEAR